MLIKYNSFTLLVISIHILYPFNSCNHTIHNIFITEDDNRDRKAIAMKTILNEEESRHFV